MIFNTLQNFGPFFNYCLKYVFTYHSKNMLLTQLYTLHIINSFRTCICGVRLDNRKVPLYTRSLDETF